PAKSGGSHEVAHLNGSGNVGHGAAQGDRAADVCVFDAGTQVILTTHSLKSQGKNTPFLGYELPGKVRYTLVDGAVVYEA
ncbi:MAG: hypothetical protein EBR07_11895, partial [Planctomycetes bacterium]|nr:hypothetical protein [Planctomycetota bacterium]